MRKAMIVTVTTLTEEPALAGIEHWDIEPENLPMIEIGDGFQIIEPESELDPNELPDSEFADVERELEEAWLAERMKNMDTWMKGPHRESEWNDCPS